MLSEEKKYLDSILYYVTDFSLENLALNSELFKFCFNLNLEEKYSKPLSESTEEKTFYYEQLNQNTFLSQRPYKLTISRMIEYMNDKTISYNYSVKTKMQTKGFNTDCLNQLSKFILYHYKNSNRENLINFIVFTISLSSESHNLICDFIMNGIKIPNISVQEDTTFKKAISEKFLILFNRRFYTDLRNLSISHMNWQLSFIYMYPYIYKHVNYNSILCKSKLNPLNKALKHDDLRYIEMFRNYEYPLDEEESNMNNASYTLEHISDKKILNIIFSEDYDLYLFYYNVYISYVLTDNLDELKKLILSLSINQKDEVSLAEKSREERKRLFYETSKAFKEFNNDETDNLMFSGPSSSSKSLNTILDITKINYNILISEYNTNMIVGCKSFSMLKYLLSLGVKIQDKYYKTILFIDESMVMHLFNNGYKFDENKFLEYKKDNRYSLYSSDVTFYYFYQLGPGPEENRISEHKDDKLDKRFDYIMKCKKQYKQNLYNNLKRNNRIEICDDILKLVIDFL